MSPRVECRRRRLSNTSMDAQRPMFDLVAMCAVLVVSVSGDRAWKRGGHPERRWLTDPQMIVLIQAIHAEFKGADGSPRLLRERHERGFPASKERGERRMREHGIRARHQRRDKATPDSKVESIEVFDHASGGTRPSVTTRRSSF